MQALYEIVMKRRVILWFRNDLRLADNPALLEASTADEVMPIYIITPGTLAELTEPKNTILWATKLISKFSHPLLSPNNLC